MNKNYCRFCGQLKLTTELNKIFDKSISDPKKDIGWIMFKCFRIIIKTDDTLTKLICTNCTDQSISVMKFYERIIETQTFLKNLANQKNTQSETLIESKCSDDDWNNDSVDLTIDSTDGDDVKSELSTKVEIVELFEPKREENLNSDHNNELSTEKQDDLELEETKIELEDSKIELKTETFDSNESTFKKHETSESFDSSEEEQTKTESQKKWSTMMKKLNEEYKDYVWRCHICVKELKTKNELIRHFRNEHNKPPEFSCIDCSQIFTDSCKFRWHVRRHRGVPELRCKICGKWFVLGSLLRRHIYHVHEQRDDQKFMCPKCGKNYKTKTSLQIHDLYVHQKKHDGLECDICQKKCPSKTSLNLHKQIHEDFRFICENCGMKFKTKVSLDYHITHSHLKDSIPAIPCPSCSKTFKSQIFLSRHIKRMHNINRVKFECEICGKKKASKFSYKQHMRIHSGELPFPCQYCKKRFRIQGTLKVHLRQHTGERPYLCKECNLDFACSANYLKHKRRKHNYPPSKRQDL